ncbi:RNA-binding domain-containing protein [Corallococcus exercitus]|uniref:Transcriptional regulator n=1 Tax=Corallococcus exercitus TaxID=2316736 RepID=A0A7Y4NGU6_9BACT|nr:RNA-binding domain-containing protein [Corallococcus exercitus]NOK12956.1 transcriptional regulator [Corallococcus exercitus]
MMRYLRDQLRSALEQVQAGRPAQQLESVTLDFKREGRSLDDFMRELAGDAICFTNASGGVLVIGVDDKQGGPAAFLGTTLDAEQVRRRIYELTRPSLLVEVEEQYFSGVRLLIAFVPQGIEVHSDPQGRSRRRLGSDCLPMSPEDIARLRDERRSFDWSAQPSGRAVQEASPLAIQAAKESLAKLTDERRNYARLHSPQDLLRALGLVTHEGELLKAGELLFCDASPSPAVQYQYRQTPGGEPRAIHRVDAPLVLAFDKILGLIEARLNQVPVSLPNGQLLDVADFPALAIREAIINALVHRDYRLHGAVLIEHSPQVFIVTSPGPLVAGVTPQNILTHPPKPRNAALAKASRTLGFAEEAGRGVDRMYREMIRSGRDIPHIETLGDLVQIKLIGGASRTQIARFIAQLPEHERDDTDTLLILFWLRRRRTVTALEAAPLLQKSALEAETILRRLASNDPSILEATRQTARSAHPAYRLRGEVLRELGSAVDYQRRTVDEMDRKVMAHVREYGRVNNRTLQNLFDIDIPRARDVLADMVERQLLIKVSSQQRGPAVEYGPGAKFPGKARARKTAPASPTKGKRPETQRSLFPPSSGPASQKKPRGHH